MFTDRAQAGRQLARALQGRGYVDPVVLALPRGGVPLALEVARALNTELDVLIVRKLGAPSNPEFAFGAVGEGGAIVLDEQTMAGLHIDGQTCDRIVAEQSEEIARRIDSYRQGKTLTDLTGRTVIIVDDGLATGSTAAAGVAVARHLGASRIIVAVPTGSIQAVRRLEASCDEVICLETPAWFGSVGAQYESFPQVSDSEVTQALRGNP